ncbi:MAG: hypothetical protein NT062_17425, partial [Proteobacteria bacterium]|nr:hypothetical protein [Pseudomonadota bacterium]
TLLGRKVLVDDVTVDATLTGPIGALVVHGAVATRSTTLTLDGTVDLADRLRPHYQLVLAGVGTSEDRLITQDPRMPAIATDLRITAAGAGFTLADLDATITVDVGATTIGTIAIAGLSAKLVAAHGGVHLDTFTANGLGFELGATGRVGADAVVHGRLTVAGDPAETLRVLHAAGIAVPRRLPPLGKLALAVTADGVLDGALVVALEPTRLALARGTLDLGGTARLANKVVVDASTTIALHGLDLGALAQLAGRPPRIAGSLSGTVTLTRSPTAQHADYDVAIALREPALTLLAQGRADATHATATARIVHAGIALGHVTAELPLDARGLARTRAWHVVVDAPARSLAALLALVPPPLRARLPPDLVGDVTLHADVRGTPSRPRGTLDARVTGPRHGDLHAIVTPTDDGRLAVATTGTLGMDVDGGGELAATLAGTVTVGGPALVVDETLAIAARPLADVPRLPPTLAALGGTVGGRVHVTGTPPTLALDASVAWRGYRTASGTANTTLALTGSPIHLVATVAVTPRSPTMAHAGATIVADVTRSADRVDVVARAHADDQPLLPLLPALLPTFPPEAEIGRLRWDMAADLGVALGPTGPTIDRVGVTGNLALRGGAFALPHTARRWHGIDLEIAGAPEGVRLVTLDLHERDRELADRHLHASGLLTITHLRPTRLALALTARDWLLLGTTPAGLADAPTGALDATLRIDADLTTPVIGVDATVDQLTLRAPDRHDRAHQPERASIAGDVIF